MAVTPWLEKLEWSSFRTEKLAEARVILIGERHTNRDERDPIASLVQAIWYETRDTLLIEQQDTACEGQLEFFDPKIAAKAKCWDVSNEEKLTAPSKTCFENAFLLTQLTLRLHNAFSVDEFSQLLGYLEKLGYLTPEMNISSLTLPIYIAVRRAVEDLILEGRIRVAEECEKRDDQLIEKVSDQLMNGKRVIVLAGAQHVKQGSHLVDSLERSKCSFYHFIGKKAQKQASESERSELTLDEKRKHVLLLDPKARDENWLYCYYHWPLLDDVLKSILPNEATEQKTALPKVAMIKA